MHRGGEARYRPLPVRLGLRPGWGGGGHLRDDRRELLASNQGSRALRRDRLGSGALRGGALPVLKAGCCQVYDNPASHEARNAVQAALAARSQ